MAEAATGDPVAAAIANWRPKQASPEALRFARDVVTACGCQRPGRAGDLLGAALRLATFGLESGLEPTAAVLLRDAVIERLVVRHATTLSGGTLRTLRTNLRFIARHARVDAPPRALALPRQRAKRPYAPLEVAGFLTRADAQSTLARRLRASALVCLGAGAGLTGADLRHLRGTDVERCSGGLVVSVGRGPHPRRVPVLARYHERILEAAAFAGGGYVVGGTDADRHNVTNRLVSSIAGGDGLPRLDLSRLRATWLHEVAGLLHLQVLMAAAGLTCSQQLGDLTATLAAPAEDVAVRLLGGTP